MYDETSGPDQTGRFAFKKFQLPLNQMDMSALDHNTNESEDDESQAKLVLVAALNGTPNSFFHTM